MKVTTNSKNGAVTWSCMNFSIYVGHVIIILHIICTAACCFSSKVGVSVKFNVWLVSGYAHVFLLLSVVTVTFPHFEDELYELVMRLTDVDDTG